MSLLVASDLHAHTWPRFATTLPDGRNSRFADLMNVLDQVEGYIEEFRPNWLVLLGDLTHQRYFLRFSVYNPLMDWIVKMRKRGNVNVLALVGNHDIEAEGVHSLGPLEHAGITVIDEPTLVDLGANSPPGFFVPYMDGIRVATSVREYQAVGETWLFAHYALDGKAMSGGEYELPSALTLTDCDAFARLFFGHVHTPAVEHDARVIYVGAPLHFDFGDVGDRFCWYFPDGGGSPRALKLDAPKFITTTYPRIGTAPLEHSGFLRVLNTPSALFEDVRKEAVDQGWLDSLPIEERMPEEAVRTLSAPMLADEQAVRAYVGRQYSELAETERQHMIDFGLECLREAQR